MIESRRTRFFDFFLLLLAFFSIVGLAQRFGAFQAGAKEEPVDFSVELLLENVDFQTADCIAEGEELRAENGAIFGTIQKIDRAPHEFVFYHEGHELRASFPTESVQDVRLTVVVSGRKSDRILLRSDGKAVLTGQTLRLYSLRAALSLTVVST